MNRLFYRPENAWVGDLIPYYENGMFYAFYLHDPRKEKANMLKRQHGIWSPQLILKMLHTMVRQ